MTRHRNFSLGLLLLTTLSSAMVVVVDSFSPPSSHLSPRSASISSTITCQEVFSSTRFLSQNRIIRLQATTPSSSGGKKKRRRRRKDAPPPEDDSTTKATTSKTATQTSSSPSMEGAKNENFNNNDEEEEEEDDDVDDEMEDVDIATIKDVASFSFDGNIEGVSVGSASAPSTFVPTAESEDVSGAIPLPDIKDTLRKKQVQAELDRIEQEQELAQSNKIDRNDRKALLKLLEQQPYADADDSFFEEQEYTTVSALLGERAKPFLGIPTGPLQVGHFIGALVIVLMAFVEYPGFPLTNLPTPLRGALQGGLGVVYAINIVLAILAAFKAGERGQPAVLWIAKTFSVGGLAYDQLTQLPTLEEMEKAKARKGKRALKNLKKSK